LTALCSTLASFSLIICNRLKLSGGKEKESTTSYFSVKPTNVTKTYFFAVPKAELDSWYKVITTAESAEQTMRETQVMQLKLQWQQQQEQRQLQAQRQQMIGVNDATATPPSTGAPMGSPNPGAPQSGELSGTPESSPRPSILAPPNYDPLQPRPGMMPPDQRGSLSRHTAPVEIANWQQDFHHQYPSGYAGFSTNPGTLGTLTNAAAAVPTIDNTSTADADALVRRSASLAEVGLSSPETEVHPFVLFLFHKLTCT